jgi:hypothetical protein
MYPTSYTGFGTTFSNVPAYGTTSTLVGQFANNTNTFGFYIGQAVTPALTHIIPRFQWTHHAIVRSGSTVTIYRNGTSLGTITTSSTLNANSLALGGYTDGTNPFYGYISNARLVKGTALYTGTFTPSTTPLTAVANTSLLTLQTSISASNNAFVDSSQANQLVTRAGTVTQGTFTPYGSNWSNYFDGTGDYLTLASNAALAMGTGDFTFESWIYPLSWTNTTNPMIISGASAALQVGKNNATGGFGVASFGLSWIISNATLPTLNTWTHVAVTRSGTTLKMFLNGVQSGSTATDTTNFTSILYVGNNADYFNGYISNLRLVKGTALYTSTFTPSTTPLTAVSGTSLLTCQSNRIIDNSSNTFAITKNGDVTVVRASPFGTGSTNAVYSNTSVTGGSIYYQTTTTDYLSIPTSENFNLSGDFSIECWVYPTAQLATDWGIIDARVSAGSATSWIWSLRTVSGVYKLSFYTGAFSTGTNAIPLNAWTHVAITRSGSSVKFFVNGVVDGTTTLSNAFNAGANPVYIGSKDLATAGYGTQGYISDLRIIKGAATYTSAFTPPTAPLTTTASTTLALKFTNSGINDNMGLSDLIASGNSQVVTSTEKYGTGSMYFDGTGDYLTAPNSGAFSFGTGNFTIEGWVYMTSYVSSGACLLGTVNGATSGYYVNLGSNINSFRVTSNASGSWADNITCSTGNGIPLNEWVHVAFVRNGANITLYKNGVSVATSSSAIAYNYSSPNNAGYVGYVNNGSSTQYFPGYIDDLRVTKGIARYTSNFTPPGLLPAR